LTLLHLGSMIVPTMGRERFDVPGIGAGEGKESIMKDSAVLDRPPVAHVERHEAAVQRVMSVVQRSIDSLTTEELNNLAERLDTSLNQRSVSPHKARLAHVLIGRDFSQAERVELEQWALAEHFRHREDLLRESLTAPEVARLLGVSRQAPGQRAKSGSLLAVMDRGALRFPHWQFDANADGGVLPGLSAVTHCLRVSPLAKISWMTRPNAYLDGTTPLECLRSGHVEKVTELARGVEQT
jgi:hypothetical protein